MHVTRSITRPVTQDSIFAGTDSQYSSVVVPRTDGLVLVFVLVAVALRIIFWVYTDRVWEDALITLNPAKNLWAGYGLTHHALEPRVYSFTSMIAMLLSVIGEPFGQAINLIRFLSLVTAAGTIYFAAAIMRHFSMPTLAQFACLAFLAADHLQIFFGMAGMETQIATCIALATVFFCVTDRLIWFGVFAGLALLARPDMIIVDAICFVYLVLAKRWVLWKPALIAAAIIAPWITFTTLYYGSPIPHTITVKSFMNGPLSLDRSLSYASNLWKQFAPFWEFWFVKAVPVPELAPIVVVALTAVCALIGIFAAVRQPRLLIVALIVLAFATYLIWFAINPYFMWYAPPFVAFYFILVAAGLAAVRRSSAALANVIGTIIAIAYSVPLAFTLPLDRIVQQDVEVGVRAKTG